jgi:KTSC domain
MALTNYPVSSSAIARVDYDEETQECFVTFTDGRSYTLIGVPQIEVERWVNSGSAGAYWNANMRGRY